MAHDKPFWESDSGKPIYETDSGKPVLGNPDNCPCCGGGAGPCDSCDPPNGGCGNDIAQPDAVVTVAGACDAGCEDAANTYPHFAFDVGSCMWSFGWTDDPITDYGRLDINYDSESGKWYARLRGRADSKYWDYGDSGAEGYWYDVTGNITCNPATCYLSGSFDLPGIAHGGSAYLDCSGCTATVTLGG